MKLSIIIPAYNVAKKLPLSLDSILSQAAEETEILVIDGASTDGTVELLQTYGDRIRWVSEPDIGVYDAMNRGIAMANGDYLFFLGAGDTLEPGILRKIVPSLPDRQLSIVYGNVFLEGGKRHAGKFNRYKLSRINICHQALFTHKTVYELIGGFDLRYMPLADYVLNLKAYGSPEIRFEYVDEVVARFESGGLSATRTDPQFMNDRLRLIRENLGIGPYAMNKLISLIPSGLKEWRYQTFQRLKSRLRPGSS